MYQIANAGNLYWFADYVNRSSQNASASAKLTADITVNSHVLTGSALNSGSFKAWTPIGKDSNLVYKGTFDGNGKTISGLYYSGSNKDVGLFGCVGEGARLQNISVTDSYFHTVSSTQSSIHIGGLVGWASSSSNTDKVSVLKCSFDGAVSCSVGVSTSPGGSAIPYVGGLVGRAYGVTLTGCRSTAKVSLTNDGGTYAYVGGLVGYAVHELAVERCYNIGKVSATGGSSATYVGSVIGYTENAGNTVTSCYYLTGTAASGVGNGTDIATAKSAEAFASGEVCYLLNGSTSLGTPVWYQTCGDGLPALSGKTVFKIGETYRNSEKKGDVNGDGEIDILDLVRMKKNFALNANTQEMDVNSDNKSDTNDMVLLRKFIMNVISSFN